MSGGFCGSLYATRVNGSTRCAEAFGTGSRREGFVNPCYDGRRTDLAKPASRQPIHRLHGM